MFYHEHNPPHFHAKYQEHEAEIEIQTLRMLKDSLPKGVKAMVLEWAEEHRDELFSDWNLGREKKNLEKINPLE